MTSTATVALPPISHAATLPRAVTAPAAGQQVGPTQGPKSQSANQGHGVDLRPNRLLHADTMLRAQGSEDDPDGNGLSPEEEAELDAMKERDAEVKRHEQAHARVGGQYAGAPQYQYEMGPDGRRYAVSGSVAIDVSPIPGEPKETIRKMDIVKRAAMAPADPSAQDRAVAARAQQEKLQAQRELTQRGDDDDPFKPADRTDYQTGATSPATTATANPAGPSGPAISAGLIDTVI